MIYSELESKKGAILHNPSIVFRKASIYMMLAFLVFFFLPILPAFAATYYVSNQGKDTNNGLSLGAAFKTIQKAVNIATAGDLIEVQPGMYVEAVLITKSGTIDKHIKFKANGKVNIDGMGFKGYGVKLDGANYIEIEGFVITGMTGSGILLNKANYNVIKSNNCYSNKATGIKLQNSSCNNVIDSNLCSSNYGGNNAWGNRTCGIYVFGSSNNNTITNNKCLYNGSTGIWLENASSNCVISYNQCYLNNYAGIISVGDTNNNQISYNLVYSNKNIGIHVGWTAYGNSIKNNTIYKNGWGIWLDNKSSVSIKNNIITHNSYGGVGSDGSCSGYILYCDVWNNGSGGTINYSGCYPTNIIISSVLSTDPRYKSTDLNSSDFLKLKSINKGDDVNSPCIDAGDQQDQPGPLSGSRIDMGAFDEYSLMVKGPMAIWHFDENKGATAYDSTANANNGTIVNALWTKGVLGSGLSFDGSGDYIDCGNSSFLNPTDEISVSLWFKFQEVPTWWNRLIAKEVWTSDNNKRSYFFVTAKDTPVLAWQIYTADRVSHSLGTQPLELNKWYYAVGTYKSGDFKLYLNGQVVSSSSSVYGPLQAVAEPFCIGSNSAHGENFKGAIDEVKIYNLILTPQEIKVEYEKCIQQNTTPEISQFTPLDRSMFTEADTLKIEITAKDSDGNVLEYQYLVDGQVKQSWTSSASYNWQTQNGDFGEHKIKVQVRDDIGAMSESPERKIFIFRKPIGPP